MMSASCSIAPDSRRSLIKGRLSARCSTPRFSWDKAITGTLSSFARPLSPREIAEISLTTLFIAFATHELKVVNDDEV